MNVVLPRPSGQYDANNEANTRRSIEQAFGQALSTSAVAFDQVFTFATLPADPPVGARYFVTDRGAHGKPVWRYASGWVDGAGTVVT